MRGVSPLETIRLQQPGRCGAEGITIRLGIESIRPLAIAALAVGSANLLSLVLPAYAEVDLTISARADGGVQPVVRGDPLASGDEISISVESSRDAYIYVFALGSSGKAELLFPFNGDPEIALTEASTRREIPGEGEFLPLDGNVGNESVYAVATERPLADLRRIVEQMAAAASPQEVRDLLLGTLGEVDAITFEHVATRALAVREAPVPSAAVIAAPSGADNGKRDWLFGGSPTTDTGTEAGLGAALSDDRIESRVLERSPRRARVQDEPLPRVNRPVVRAPEAPRRPISVFGDESEPGVLASAGSRISALLGETVPGASSTATPQAASRGEVASRPSALEPTPLTDPGQATVMVVTGSSIGTGVVVAPHGHILVPWHVVAAGGPINVVFRGERDRPDRANILAAKLVRHSAIANLAMITVDGGESLAQAQPFDSLWADSGLTLVSHDSAQRWFTDDVTLVQPALGYQWTSLARGHRADGLLFEGGRIPDTAGGPIFDSDNRLIAFVIHVDEEENAFFALGADTLIRFIGSGGLAAN